MQSSAAEHDLFRAQNKGAHAREPEEGKLKRYFLGESPQLVDRQERCVALLASILVCFSPVAKGAETLLELVGIPYAMGRLMCFACIGLVALYAMPYLVRRIPWKELLLFVVLVAAIGFSWFQNQSDLYNSYFLGLFEELLLTCLPAYVVCRALRRYDELQKYLMVGAYAILVGQLITLTLDTSSLETGRYMYSQKFAYQTLPATVILIDKLFRISKIRSAVLPVIGLLVSILFIVLSGTRTPLLIIAVFGFFRLLVCTKLKRKRFVIVGICIAALVAFALFSDPLVAALDGVFKMFGLNSRTLYLLQGDNFFLSGRTSLYSNVFELIGDHAIVGTGVGADRILIVAMQNVDVSLVGGHYPHNIFLELVLQFGIPIGVVLCVALVAFIVVAIKHAQAAARDVIVVIMAVGLFPLFLSGSYLGTFMFFGFLGMCMTQFQDWWREGGSDRVAQIVEAFKKRTPVG